VHEASRKVDFLHYEQGQAMPTRLPASKTAQFYLIAYNTVCALAWAYVLQRTIQHMRGPTVTAWLPSLWSDRHKFLSRARTAYTDFGKEVRFVLPEFVPTGCFDRSNGFKRSPSWSRCISLSAWCAPV
jgi:hypothetical protein